MIITFKTNRHVAKSTLPNIDFWMSMARELYFANWKKRQCIITLMSYALFQCLSFTCKAQPISFSNLVSKKIWVQADSMRLDSLSIVPGTLTVIGKETLNYTVDYLASIVRWKRPFPTDSVQIQYRTFPSYLPITYFHKDIQRIEKSVALNPFYYDALEASKNAKFIDFGRVDYNGSFGRALSFGNNQDVVLNSQFNLQLEGDLGDSIKLTGAITDNTIPFQPEGNTQQLQEFDRVSIQLQRKRTSLLVGDYEIRKPVSYFMNFFKRVQGGFFSTTSKTSAEGENKISLGVSLAKGKFVRNVLTALEGNQGPYKLTGPNGEQFFIILAGTERVYIDGIQMQRGEEYDYVIDYNTAEVTFMPRRLITKDLRLSVEFEFSDRNYLNSLVYLQDEWKVNNKWMMRFNMYSNQDAKNQTVQQTLDSSKIRFLASIGDSIQQAFYTSVQRDDTFSASKILYKKIDTTVGGNMFNNVYVFSTNVDSAKYSLSFSFVGAGLGNYKQSVNSANGRVYAWTAPSDGNRTGDYEPIIVLVTPKRTQMFSVATTFTPDSNRTITVETAVSNNDPNTFSSIDNASHPALATKLFYTDKRMLSKQKDWLFKTNAQFEYVMDRFKPIERFRTVEFARDWNVPLNDIARNEQLASIALSLAKAGLVTVDYQIGNYIRGNDFKGLQQIASIAATKNGYRLFAKGDWMQQSSTQTKSNFLRPYVEIEKQLKYFNQLTFGSKLLIEHNALKNASTDSLSNAAFSFDVLSFYVKNSTQGKNYFSADYTHRIDRAAKENKLAQSTEGHTFSVQSVLGFIENQELKIHAAYRILDIVDTTITALKPDESLLGRLEYNFTMLKGLFTGNVLYEFGSGQEQKREFAYVEVPIGQGQYVWRDYNKDSLRQLNEFEFALFQDEKRFIKVFTPTNQYVKAKYSMYNQAISINPKALWSGTQASFLQKAASLFFIQSAIQLNNRFIGERGIAQYNPFLYVDNDSLLLNNASSIVHSVFFNRFSNRFGIDYIRTSTIGRTLLNYGIDNRKNKDELVRVRYNIHRQITLGCQAKTGTRFFSSPFLENRNYNIRIQALEPSITYITKNNQFRMQTTYKLDQRANAKSLGAEVSSANNLQLELKYNVLSSGSLQSRFTFTDILYDGEANSGLGYAMLDGLQRGKNYLWMGGFQKRVSKSIEMNIEYEGRKPGTGNVIHTGRASVRAIF